MKSWYKVSEHKFCEQCGFELVKDKSYISSYDLGTGDPVMRFRYRCPNYTSFWNRNHFNELCEGDEILPDYSRTFYA